MAEQTREQQETAIKIFSLAMWGAVVIFVVLAALFYMDVIPSEQGELIAVVLAAIAVFDVFLIRFMVARMRAQIKNT